jgi:hypothetical protein
VRDELRRGDVHVAGKHGNSGICMGHG